jgi:predicted ATPase
MEEIVIGLCGSHRTGKTTLAKEVARKTGLEFVQTSTSEVFLQNGLNPSEPMDFNTRIWIQNKVVSAAEEVWRAVQGRFITDRTPIDMMAYTLADIDGTSSVDFFALEKYLDHCFQVTDSLFSHLVILQPAIPLVHEEGKAALNRAYMEHLNILMQGLCSDGRLHCEINIIPRHIIPLDDRVTCIAKILYE